MKRVLLSPLVAVLMLAGEPAVGAQHGAPHPRQPRVGLPLAPFHWLAAVLATRFVPAWTAPAPDHPRREP